MKPINYQLTNTLLNNLIELEKTKAEIQTLDPNTDISNLLETSRWVNDIFFVAHMLRIEFTLKDAEKFLEGRVDQKTDLPFKLLTNYKNALDFVSTGKINALVEMNSNLALHINKIMINNWKEAWEAKFRNSIEIESSLDEWVNFHDTSINVVNIQKEFEDALIWYKENELRINPILLIGVFLYRMIRLQPFLNANKLSNMALTTFLLQKEGYTNKTLLSIPMLFDKNSEKYFRIWRDAIESPTGNITPWLESFALDIADQLKANKMKIIKTLQENKGSTKQPFLNLNKRQLKILRYLQTIPSVKREDYVQMFEVSTMTAFRDMNELVEKKLLRVEGKGRATRYLLMNR